MAREGFGQPSNPVGYGISNFLNSFAGELDNKTKSDREMAGKKEFERYHEELQNKAEEGKNKRNAANNATKLDPRAHASSKSAVSSADKYFMQQFSKAKENYLKLVNKYKNPNIMNDMDLYNRVKGLSQEEREHLAEVEYAKQDPEGHTLVSDPKNIAHYHQLMGMGTSPAPTGGTPAPSTGQGLLAPVGAPTGGPPPPTNPDAQGVTMPGASSMAPAQVPPPGGMNQPPSPMASMPPTGAPPQAMPGQAPEPIGEPEGLG